MKCCTLCLSAFAVSAAVVTGVSVAVASHEAPIQSVLFADVISGSWEGFAVGDQLPEDLPLWVTLEMDEEGDVVGTFGTPDGDAPFAGFFDDEEKILTGMVTPPDASWELELSLDGDTLEGEATETNSGMVVTVTLTRSDE